MASARRFTFSRRLRCRPWLLAWTLGLSVLLVGPRSAHAYYWMIRHSYTSCQPCHADPSGEGLLTQYGRAQSEILLSTRYGRAADREPGRAKDFLFGVPTP